MILPHGFLEGLPHVDVITDSWKIIVAAENTAVGDELTMQHMRESPWIMTYQSRTAYTPPARQLQMLGVEPQVEAVVEGFLALPHFIAGTNRLGIIQASLVPQLTGIPGVRYLDPPFDAMQLVDALWWHPMHSRDPAHAWMRSLFIEAGAELAASDAANAN